LNKKPFEKYFVFSPYIWLVLFFFIPLAIIFKISISVSEWGMPPYQDIFVNNEGFKINITLENYVYILSDFYYIRSFLNSIVLALISTFFCILIGFPLAFYIATSDIKLRNILLILVIIPFWSSFLLRVYAWKIILQNNGILNLILLKFGIISEPLQLLYNQYAVIMGIVYTYLPLMILPLYGYLNKFDLNLIDASKDLGLNRIKSFFRVILPLSLPGIIAGSLLVFIPVVGEFIIPEMLGGSDKLYYGKILWEEFFVNRNWPGASALAFTGIIVLVLPIIIFQMIYSKWTNKNEI
jgi:putrescine transport system permease protein